MIRFGWVALDVVYSLVRIHAKHENKLKGFVEPEDNIHDSGKVVIFATHRKDSSHAKSKAIIDSIKKTRPGASRAKYFVDVDLDLRSQIQTKGKKLVSYSSSNNQFVG